MGVVTMIAGLILSLSILVVLHELGHFLPAKFFKTKVEKFYLFFDPYFSLFKKKIGETEYGIGWLPLGGYVKIAGMIDESFDTEQMEKEPEPWEFRSKPAWQRLIIMLGGVTVNFILGFFIFGMMLFTYGEKYLPTANAKHGISVDTIGYALGLRDGDQILAVGDVDFDKFEPGVFTREVVLNGAKTVEVRRDGRSEKVDIHAPTAKLLSQNKYRNYDIFSPRFPFIIKGFGKNSINEDSGLKIGDQVVKVNGAPTPFAQEATREIMSYKEESIVLDIMRDGRSDKVTVRTNETGRIGVNLMTHVDLFEIEREEYTLARALPAGVAKGYNFLADQMKAFGKMFSGEIRATDSLGGFGTITSLFPKKWNWEQFWRITAMLSMILGFMNLLPIPALDGGHVMFLIYEAVTGRKLSDKFMEYATLVGFILVIGLVLFANGLDVWRWFTGK